jgi:ATP-dependent exoDNAse (exonuclease V) alpha subunit
MTCAQLEFSADQSAALSDIEGWRHRRDLPYFTLGGYAGCGKSTLASYLADSWASTAVVALCGKAANVLRNKGVADAKTIHSLIYVPFEDEKTGKIHYRKRDQLEGIRSVIVDEASMVDHLLLCDLLSFDLPVLFIGDHGQLEPIGTNPNLMKSPHVRLERIHRQAEGNPILRLAAAFREGRNVPYWKDREGRLCITHRSNFAKLIRPGVQVICGYNGTRHKVNAQIRGMQGIKNPLPVVGERIICLRNSKELGIFNGQLFDVLSVGKITQRWIDLQVKSEGGNTTTIPCLREQFGVNVLADYRDQSVALMDFGYCLTGHKSQGSEFADVLILEEIAGAWNPQRWRYTVTTRAKERLTYCA